MRWLSEPPGTRIRIRQPQCLPCRILSYIFHRNRVGATKHHKFNTSFTGKVAEAAEDSGPNQHRSLAWRRQSPVAKWHRPVGLQKLSRIPLFGVSFRQSLGVRALGACAQRQVLSHAKHDRPARQWWCARAVSFFRWLCKELQPKFVMTFPPRLPQMHHACFHYLLRLEGYVELLHMHDKRCPQHARQSKLGLERSHKILEMATLVPVRERERERERER